MCLYVPGFQRQVFKPVKFLTVRSKRMKEQKKNKESVLVAESAFNSQNTQFGLVMPNSVMTTLWFFESKTDFEARKKAKSFSISQNMY